MNMSSTIWLKVSTHRSIRMQWSME